MAKAKTTEGKITDLIPDDRNANRHSDRGIELVDKSFKELGAGRSVVVDRHNKLIAGNNSQRAATEAGITKTVVVETDGDTLVVVKRTDLDLDSTDDPRARQMALIDNSSALYGIEFQFDVAESLGEVFGFDVADWGIEMPEEVGEDVGKDGFSLADGDRAPFQQMTFTLADEQATVIKNAIADMKETDEYKYAETMGNENSNGNALYLIVATWAGQRI